MLSLIAVALITAAPAPQGDEFQVLAGSRFEAFLQDVGARCPASRVIYVKAATLLDAEETFGDSLHGRRAAALSRAAKADSMAQACLTRDGAGCSAVANLGVYRKAGLMPAFVAAVCARGDGPWD